MIVPTRAAARQLGYGVTRDELYDVLHSRLANPPRRLTPIERDAMAQAAARAVAAAGVEISFHLRPGLVAEMLQFYDHLRRQSQQVGRFEELIAEALGVPSAAAAPRAPLGSDDVDRAADRMRRQTRFLADMFRDYERRVRDGGACDEHTLRDRLVAETAADPVRRVVVTVADWIADPDGLCVADFDMLTRVPGIESLDIVATERVLGSGFHERLHTWLPGIEEVDCDVAQPFKAAIAGLPPSRVSRFGGPGKPCATSRPVLVTTPDAPADQPWWTFRDREEELVAVARNLAADRQGGEGVPLDRTAVVYKHPLPYLYLAPEIFGGAGIPYHTDDALPLAAEPTAASLDLVLDAVAANFSRSAIVALLRSPHFLFMHDGVEITRHGISALDRALSEARYLGDLDRLSALAAAWFDRPESRDAIVLPALHAGTAAARELAPLAGARPASTQIRCLLEFWSARLRPLDEKGAVPLFVVTTGRKGVRPLFSAGTEVALASRERRARAAVADMLTALAAAYAAHDDPSWTIDEVAVAVRRWIEAQTFAPESADTGVCLLDDRAARYGDFDDITIVGVVEPEWPERPRRNIFYPPGLLKSLGWASEKDRRAGADAQFLDLVAGAARRTAISIFTLEDDTLVTRSIQLDEIPRARLSTAAVGIADGTAGDSIAGREELSAWAELRTSRTAADAPEFHGTVGTGAPAHSARFPRAWSVSALETYLDCPFKFFAQHVLKLEEEPDDEEVMDPRRQGQLVHAVFERFFDAWQKAGHRAITPNNLDTARQMFTEVVDGALGQLPTAEAALERTRLLGSPAAAGLGEAVLRMEAERPVAVVERLLESRLEGEFTVTTAEGPRTVALRGKADRVDLLEDGTFRLIDYKLGWPPNRARALQLPIYSLCAEQRLTSHRGRNWTLGEAVYLAFKGPRRVVPLFSPSDRAKVLAEAEQRLADTLDAVARAEFPPRPDDVWRCETCSFAAVCRKDYVGEV